MHSDLVEVCSRSLAKEGGADLHAWAGAWLTENRPDSLVIGLEQVNDDRSTGTVAP
jgi:hypothetical protein